MNFVKKRFNMSKSHQSLWFPIVATAILTMFATLLVVVTFIGFTKRSGRTGMDMAEMHLLRAKASAKSIEP